MKQELRRREFPDIDEALHCIAVKCNDELKKLWRQDDLSPADTKQMTDLTNLLLLVKKQLPGKTKKKKQDKVELGDIFG
jgi:hypothetical protein